VSVPAPVLSLVLACYNEAEHLEASVAEIRRTLESWGQPFELVFVDDASGDSTWSLLERLRERHADLAVRLLRHETNRGRGRTVGDGFRAARAPVAGYLDVDLEVHCRYVPSLVDAILRDGADVATIRRVYHFQLRSLDRWLMSQGYAWLVRRLLGTRLVDTESGYKFFRRERLLPLLDTIEDPGWFWDTECMLRAERAGLRIVEIPGAFVRRYDKRSTVRGLRDSADYFVKLLRFRRRLREQP